MEPATLSLSQSARDLAGKRHAENFPVASWFLPHHARAGMLAFYRFARHADDIADSAILPRERKVAILENAERALAGNELASLPEWAKDYHHAILRGEIGLRHGKALLSAFLQDTSKARYASWEELVDYCMHSAAPVGRAVLELHREWHANMKASDALCNALQILNHLQDLKKDFRELNRIYLPVGWLENPDYLAGDYAAPDVRRAIDLALGYVEVMIEDATRLPASLRGFRARVEVCLILEVARKLAKELRRRDPIAFRVTLSRSQKLRCVVKAIIAASFTRHASATGFTLTRASRTSFFWPLLTLPGEKRDAMFALYAFCRAIDDAVDDAPSGEEATRQLAFWRHEVAALYSTQPLSYPAHPVTRALFPAIRRYRLQREHFDAMLEALALDAQGAMLRPTAYELERYCYGAASCVGLHSVRIFGAISADAEEFARRLGKAFQLINILRDVREDAARGRIYLPMELLTRYGLRDITPENIVERREELKPVLAELAKQAREQLTQSEEFLRTEERSTLKTALAMRRIYARYLDMLEAQGLDITAPRVRLPGWKKLWLAIR